MPAYSFQRQFEADIRGDFKRHTIRNRRKRRPTRVGDVLYLYVGLRTKRCVWIKDRLCTRIQPVIIKGRIHRYGGFIGGVFVDGQQLMQDELEALAVSDGFPNFETMIKFWKGRLPFDGEMLHWESDAEWFARIKSESKEKPAAKRRKAK